MAKKQWYVYILTGELCETWSRARAIAKFSRSYDPHTVTKKTVLTEDEHYAQVAVERAARENTVK